MKKKMSLLVGLLLGINVVVSAQKLGFATELNAGYNKTGLDYGLNLILGSRSDTYFIGAGAGYTNSVDNVSLIPIFTNLRFNFTPKRTTAYSDFRAGYNIPTATKTTNSLSKTPIGGFLASIGLGLQFSLGEDSPSEGYVCLGYKYSKSGYKTLYYGGIIPITNSPHLLNVQFGILL